MPLTRYVSNTSSSDPVGAIKLEPDSEGVERILVKGETLELTDKEFASLSGQYVLKNLDEQEDKSSSTSSVQSFPPASSQSVAPVSSPPSTPAQGS
jgi:hypothetical protein